VAKQV
jgi:hypothetical protein